jgi:hypothetical protein
MLQFGSFLERAEAALGKPSLSLIVLHIALESRYFVLSDVGFTDESGEELYGSFSLRVEASLTAMASVLHIMPELEKLRREVVVPQSNEHVKVDSLIGRAFVTNPDARLR